MSLVKLPFKDGISIINPACVVTVSQPVKDPTMKGLAVISLHDPLTIDPRKIREVWSSLPLAEVLHLLGPFVKVDVKPLHASMDGLEVYLRVAAISGTRLSPLRKCGTVHMMTGEQIEVLDVTPILDFAQ